jgi:hypothetical protein
VNRPRLSIASAIAVAGVAVLVAGCADQPAAPSRDPEPAVPSPEATGEGYLVLLREVSGAAITTTATATVDEVARLGGRVERSLSEIGVLQVRGLTRETAARLASQPGVEAVAQDRRVQWLRPSERRLERLETFRPQANQRDAAFFDLQWNLRRIRAPSAWNVTPQGEGVMVCILDTGVDPRQIDLAGKLDLDISASFVGTERADRDFFFHGTAMASIVTSNGLGVASVAPEARVCSVKVLDRTGSGTFGDVAAGIRYVGTAGRVDGGARPQVANMSFGELFPRNDPDLPTLTRVLQRAVDFSTNQGVLFVASSGNQGTNLNTGFVHLPSGLENVISVGATGPINQAQFDRIASYSNVGRQGVDVFAPGGEFAFARNVEEDLVITACSPSTRDAGEQPCADGDVYVLVAGTSPSAAHVSGEAAVIESKLAGNQSPARLTSCILRSADPLPNPALTARGRINVLRGQECAVP